MLPSERGPPDVEEETPSSDPGETTVACVHRQSRLFGFLLIVVSAIVALALFYAAWLGLKAT